MHTGRVDKRLPASFRQRRGTHLRLAALLLALACAIVVGKLFEESLIERLRYDCTSLFDDRLVPAMTLFHLADQMHLKHRLLSDYLDAAPGADAKQLYYEMGRHDAELARLTEKIQQTYLVEDESALLQDFRDAVAEYQRHERSWIEAKGTGDDAARRGQLEEAYARVRRSLLDLTQVQERVGSKLREESTASATSITSLLYLQLGVAFVLGLISSGLAMSLARREPSPGPTSDTVH